MSGGPSLLRAPARERVSVLDADPALGERLDGPRLARAQALGVARVLRREKGAWDAAREADAGGDGLGLLVLAGALVRQVGTPERPGAELLAPGDVLQPARHDGAEAILPFHATWRVLAPLQLAVLDLGWMARMAPFPEVTAALAARIMLRARRLATLLAITRVHRLDDRLRLCLWELADRHGRVTPDGVRLDLPLTHELLSELVGAQRPSVSAALGRLDRAGSVRRDGRTWLLDTQAGPTG